ncbi:MAG: acetate kinase [Eubacteriales bacterium]|jgi:acetate kinase|nr:acetate kinase [Lachnospiraceae bacterium]MDD5859144.1 acetate kinase [Eubacteriales bacterium]MCH4064691.1 acetate kinase [Lachnospiraceae bacterium]MCH4104923.1 acetate kinase [Lachnospiraceae bacterium]MCI1308349.1 acetate kinase [Lachnospiraceae bacterium]
MKVLVINAGSSSLKYQLIDMDNESVIAKGLCERIGIEGSKLTHKVPGKEDYVIEEAMPSHKKAIELVLKALVDPEHGVVASADEIDAIGHRVLHGGSTYTESIKVDEDVKRVIRECFDLGPLHNPANLMGIEACEAAMPGKPNVAVFDTSFGMSLKPYAYRYAIPEEYYNKYKIRRYGFHGTSHNFVSHETIKYANLPEGHQRVIVCHLGNGSSISASVGGKAVDTSMGLTPLEGVVMGTRSGSIDPAVVQFLCDHEKLSADEVLTILNKKSGVYALSGNLSSDFRDLSKAEAEGNEKAKLALDAFRHSVSKMVGAYLAVMNGADAITFTGGIGENDAEMRHSILSHLGFAGVKIDEEKNSQIHGKRAEISTPDSAIRVFVIPTNEELAIARDTVRLAF